MKYTPLKYGLQTQRYRTHTLTAAIRRSLYIGGTAAMLSASPSVLADTTFGVTVDLSAFDGSEGFVVRISATGHGLGHSVSDAGDIEVSTLDGDNGFVITAYNVEAYSLGVSVSGAGDVNGDGQDDLIIGSFGGTGRSYVIFGGNNVGNAGEIELSNLDGSDGFVIKGIDLSDRTGGSVDTAGDINGDGIADLIIGALNADPNGNSNAGETYVIFGKGGLGNTGEIELSDLNVNDGFIINGIDVNDRSGRSVSSAGDINGDSINDLIIGAPYAGPADSGKSFVVCGGGSVGSGGLIDLSDLDGSNGFTINGVDAGDLLGSSVSAVGDFNNDGVDDIVIGASRASPNGTSDAGESYVVSGVNGIGSSGNLDLSDLDGSNGFVINGIDDGDFSGRSVNSAGDVNGDGISDLVIGAPVANPNGIDNAGQSYVVFGGIGVGDSGSLDLSDLFGSNGFFIDGINANDYSGVSVSTAGDINDDGLADLIIGADHPQPFVYGGPRETYVIFGKAVPKCNDVFVTVGLEFNENPGPGRDSVLGTSGKDDIRGRAGNDTICGEGGNDFLHGNSGDDWIDGGNGKDNIRGGQGNDVLYTGSGATVATNSIVFGGLGDDEIHGGPDDDDLRGGRGIDVINGNGGNDEIRGNADNDILNGGDGDDEIRGGQGEDQLFGDAGLDFLSGGGSPADNCDGGSDIDVAAAGCEVVVNVP